MLYTLTALLAAAVVAVPLTRRAGLGSVLGYLLAGAAIGPHALGLVTDPGEVASIAEFGVVMLLFLIGLEVRPARLWVMRNAVFGMGAAQVLGTAAILAPPIHLLGLDWSGAAVLGLGLALSSTAIVLPILGERELLQSPAGRTVFSVLLFQDLAFIPLVALAPLLGHGNPRPELVGHVPVWEVARALAAIAAILAGGRYLLPVVFRLVGGAKTQEVFTATALLVVAGTAALAQAAGLSMSLGAFMAGVLLSNSQYRHELQADIQPFEGVLLGFFFTTVGITADLPLAAAHPAFFLVAVPGFVAAKALAAFLLALAARHDWRDAVRFAAALPQGSEFSFVLFAAAVAAGSLAPEWSARATLVIALSMVLTPLIFAGCERVLARLAPRQTEREYDSIEGPATPVLLLGFGRVGQVVGRLLRLSNIPFTALENDVDQVEIVRRFGTRIYFGDPTRVDLLRAAGAEQARLLIVALENQAEVLRVVDTVRVNFPHLQLLVRARNRRTVHMLMDRNVQYIVRDTFYSSLRMAELALGSLGAAPDEIRRVVDVFREHDEQQLVEQHAIYDDEQQLIQNAEQAAKELQGLIDADRPIERRPGERRPGERRAAE